MQVISFETQEDWDNFFKRSRERAIESMKHLTEVQSAVRPGTFARINDNGYGFPVYVYYRRLEEILDAERQYDLEEGELEYVQETFEYSWTTTGFYDAITISQGNGDYAEMESVHVTLIDAIIEPKEFWAAAVKYDAHADAVRWMGPSAVRDSLPAEVYAPGDDRQTALNIKKWVEEDE